MEKIYNDGLIMSPEVMEEIAKEYSKVLSEKNIITLKDISHLLEQTIINIRSLKYICSEKFYNCKRDEIIEIDKILTDTFLLLGMNENIVFKTNYKLNFCFLL